MKPILILANSDKNLLPFQKASSDIKQRVVFANYREICFGDGDKGRILIKKEREIFDVQKDFSLIFFRTVKHNMERVNLIVDYIDSQVLVVDRINKGGVYRATKAFQYRRLLSNDLPVTPFIYGSLDLLCERANLLGFPLVIKRSEGSQGRQVYLVKDKWSLRKFYQSYQKYEDRSGKYYLAQKFIDNDGDYRILVLGNQVLGVMKRERVDKNEFRNNVSLGGMIQKAVLPNSMLLMAIKAASVCEIEVAGVDIILDKENGRPFILEVNRSPQFKGLMKATGVNIPKAIIDFLIKLAKND